MICEKFGIYDKLYSKYEAEAEKTFDPDFVSTAHIEALATEAKLLEEHKSNLVAYMNWASEDLKKFMWLFYYIQFKTDEDFSDNIWQLDDWKIPFETEEKYPGMLKACVYLLSADNLREWLKEHNLPSSMMDSYFDRYHSFVKLNLTTHNTNGFCRLSPFLYGYSKPFIIVVGRLAFQLTRYYQYCEAWENNNGKRTFVALPWYGYDETGHIADDGIRPVYRREGNTLVCHTFREDGTLNSEAEALSLDEYTKIMSPGDRVATIHIPGGGKLSEDLVQKSLEDAWHIINTHMTPLKAFVCKTWFIDPGLRSVFKPGANMLKFADLFDIICTEDNKNHSLFEHIFATKPTELTNLKPMNEFQQTMLDRAIRGEKIYWSYGLLKKENEKILKGKN